MSFDSRVLPTEYVTNFFRAIDLELLSFNERASRDSLARRATPLPQVPTHKRPRGSSVIALTTG